MNCRLPQTPRTPTAAASHYFDDVFTRQRRQSIGARSHTCLKRSMTRTRSIGARSDWNSTNGEHEDDEDFKSNGGPSRTWSIYKEDGNSTAVTPAVPGEDDPDDPINKYVQDQLARLRSNESNEFSEELSAQTDGANEAEL